MKLVELLKKHGIENAELEKDVESYIDATLAVKSENMIPKQRLDEVIHQRNSLKADLSEKDGELAELKAKFEKIGNVDELSKKNQELQEYVYKVRLDEWQQKASVFSSDDDAIKAKIEKIKDEFILDDELTLEQIESNLKSYQRYDKIDYFNQQEQPKHFDATPPKPGSNVKYKDPFKLPN